MAELTEPGHRSDRSTDDDEFVRVTLSSAETADRNVIAREMLPLFAQAWLDDKWRASDDDDENANLTPKTARSLAENAFDIADAFILEMRRR